MYIGFDHHAKHPLMSASRVAQNYLPFAGGAFQLRMGLTPIDETAWFELGPNFVADLAAKKGLLAARHAEVFAVWPEAEAPAAELLGLMATNLSRDEPALFAHSGDRFVNRATGEDWNIARPSLHPLDIAGRLVPEDLCLLQTIGGRMLLVGASLCSPARWLLGEKIGKPIAAIHEPVPGYAEALARPVDQFLASLKPDRLMSRFNWGIADDPAPFQPVPPTALVAATAENAGTRLWLRVERQTFRRLPRTGAIVFTIRTYITRLDEAIGTAAQAQDLTNMIRTMPAAARSYKRIAPYADALIGWLDARRGT
jgi:dimethylamine monooxygenase subunit A